MSNWTLALAAALISAFFVIPLAVLTESLEVVGYSLIGWAAGCGAGIRLEQLRQGLP
jgi:hypothetical protein